jgi:DNA-binding transcriptional regulator LsrR (DeoR family)
MATQKSEFSASDFANRLMQALDKQHLSQSQLAAALGVSRSTVTGWIRHRKLPDAYLIHHLCGALRCSADWLLGISESTEKQDSFGKIKWAEQTLPFLNDFQREQIDFGIRLFNSLLTENRPELTNDWRTMRFALQAVLHAGAIRLLQVVRHTTYEEAIKERYPSLKEVVVADIPQQYNDTLIRTELVTFLAATEVLGKIIRPNAVGLGSGYTMLRLCENSIPTIDQFSGTSWIPLLAFAPNNVSDYTANYLARLMSIRHPGSRALYLPHPHELPEMTTSQMMKNVQTIFISVSGVDRRTNAGNTHLLAEFRSADYLAEAPELRAMYAELDDKERFGAEVLRYLLDTDGNILSRDSAVGSQADLEILRYNSTVMGKCCIVAAHQYKAKAVLTCIRSKLANSLVIDSEIAEYLVTHT